LIGFDLLAPTPACASHRSGLRDDSVRHHRRQITDTSHAGVSRKIADPHPKFARPFRQP
jgi:hypothetical protein